MESGSADPVDESIDAECQIYSFCQPVRLLHDTIPTPPSKSFNGEPRPLGYRPPGTTGMRPHRSFREQNVRRQQRWWWKEWKRVQSRHTGRVLIRGRQGEGRMKTGDVITLVLVYKPCVPRGTSPGRKGKTVESSIYRVQTDRIEGQTFPEDRG